MSSVNPKKLKVLELKRELEQRNIPVSKSMKKAELVALLVSALESEPGKEEALSSEGLDDSSVSGAEVDQQAEDLVDQQAEDLEAVSEFGGAGDGVLKSDAPTGTVDSGQELVTENSDTKNENSLAISSDSADPTIQPEVQMDVGENCNSEDVQVVTEDSSASETKPDVPLLDHAASGEPLPPVSDDSSDKTKLDEKETKDAGRKRKYRETLRTQSDHVQGPPPQEEEEAELDDSLIVLDGYNSDLNFKISHDRVSGQPLTMEGFAFLWAGVRANYGVKEGKVCFECKVTQEETVKHLPSDEPHPHVVRVGWSADCSSLQLGEDAFSYGYGGTGKFSCDSKFSEYGETFHAGDVMGCYIAFCDDDHVQVSFTKNGVYQGIAYNGTNSSKKALFPHVLCKNASVELNFGQRDTPYFAHPEELEGYNFLSCVPLPDRVRAIAGPKGKKECEVLMMCGLPGAGKTYYCRQKVKDEPEKKYNILGTNIIMEKMRIMGVTRKKNYDGRWNLLIDNASQCLNRLLQIACRKRRNYILDQTNVYASAQRRKMRPFEGFQRKAIVIVPTEEEYKMRFEKRTDDEGKEVPEMAILGMKANFTLPEEGDLFDEVVFPELGRDEAKKLVDSYREEGKKHGPPPEKRFRGQNRHRQRDNGWRRGRGFRMQHGFGNEMWGRSGGPGGMPRGVFGPAGFNRGGGYGGRQPGFGVRGRDYGFGSRRENFSPRNERPNARGKGGWMEHGGRGNRGSYGAYNRHSQGRGGAGTTSDKNFQGNSGQRQGNRLPYNSQSFTPQSAQSYTYGHNQPYNAQSTHGFGSVGYNTAQSSVQGGERPLLQGQASGYQPSFGQQDYSQQWAHFYQQQAQVQQYTNYYNYQQQYYNQQSASQVPRQ